MSRSKQEVFNEVYELLEYSKPISIGLKKEASKHGIRIEAIIRVAQFSEEDDYDE